MKKLMCVVLIIVLVLGLIFPAAAYQLHSTVNPPTAYGLELFEEVLSFVRSTHANTLNGFNFQTVFISGFYSERNDFVPRTVGIVYYAYPISS